MGKKDKHAEQQYHVCKWYTSYTYTK